MQFNQQALAGTSQSQANRLRLGALNKLRWLYCLSTLTLDGDIPPKSFEEGVRPDTSSDPPSGLQITPGPVVVQVFLRRQQTEHAKKSLGPSMSRHGSCWDNAVAELFFSSLKKEFIKNTIYRTRELAKTAISNHTDSFYNPTRHHSQ